MKFTTPNQHDLAAFLKEVDGLFHVPLSARRNLDELAKKIHMYGHCLLACDGKKTMGGICWYDNDTVSGQGYFNVLAVLPQYQGRGVAGTLLKKAISQMPPCIASIKLWTQNPIALRLYLKNGFAFEKRDDDERACIEHGVYLIKPHETRSLDAAQAGEAGI